MLPHCLGAAGEPRILVGEAGAHHHAERRILGHRLPLGVAARVRVRLHDLCAREDDVDAIAEVGV